MEETNAVITKRVQKFYSDEFKKNTVLDYKARRDQYPSIKAYAAEKGLPETTLIVWLKKFGIIHKEKEAGRIPVGNALKSTVAGKTPVHRLKINGVTVEGNLASLAALIGAMSHADD